MLGRNRPELALARGKRTPEALERWTEAFGEGSRKVTERYAEILSRIAGPDAPGGRYSSYVGRYSPRTREEYGRAIAEFFEWSATVKRRVVLPREVSRKDAEDYVEWLATKSFTLEGERLRDGDQPERLALYDLVKSLGSADLESILAGLPAGLARAHEGGVGLRTWLASELGRMVLHDLLVRSPTLSELRKENSQIGIDVFTVTVPRDGGGTKEVPLEDIFIYSLPVPRPLGRSAIALRLAALSRLWTELARADVDVEPLVRTNVFDEISARVSRGLSADKRAARARRPRLTPAIVERLLAATGGPSLVEKRDAAIFWFLVLTGVRATEARRLTREKPKATELERTPGWLEPRTAPVMVELVRKGGVHHRLPYPPYALRSLYDFQSALAARAAPPGAQSEDPKGQLYVPRGGAAWRYRALSEETDAPLFPPVAFWGANSPSQYQEMKPNVRPAHSRPMSRWCLRALLKRIAEKAGLSAEESRLVYSHAFRHFAATAMSKRGKPIREIQSILGHSSVVVTEGYIEDERELDVLSGQNEILEYIAGGAAAGTPPAVPPPARVIETYGVQAREEADPTLVAESPKMGPEPATEGGLVAIAEDEEPPAPPKKDISRGSPFYAYADIGAPPGSHRDEAREKIHFTRVEPRQGKSPGTVALYERRGKDMVQADHWLGEHYDPWPLSYGLGELSLLPWFARGSASKHGEVTVTVRDKEGKTKTVTVPPLPVFAGEQLYSEIKAPTLFAKVEALRAEWMKTSPTKAFGLDRWWGAFQEIQRGLSRGTKGKFRFVPFDAEARVGKDIRAHDDDYLARWLEQNAERYTTTVRAFEHIERPRGSERDDEEWTAFMEKFAEASLVGVSPAEELPDWFLADDPVRDIYDKSPEEFSWFLKWIGSITGQDLSVAREKERSAEVGFAEEAMKIQVSEARELLKGYYESVESLRKASRAKEKDEAERERETLKLITERLAALGVGDPKVERPSLPRPLDARIEALLRAAFPSASVELVDANILRSTLFDKDSFRIDTKKRTIVHTAAFREEFGRRYDGRDSECVMRRAARGMWEHVRRHGIPVLRGGERSSEYSLLYSVMLSYIAWIVPCPEVVEKRLAAELGLSGQKARLRYLAGFRQASRRILRSSEDLREDDLRRIAVEEGLDEAGAAEVLEAGLVQDSVRAEIALPSPDVTEAIARSAVESGNIQVMRRRPTVVVSREGGPRRAVLEAPKAPQTYFSVGGEDEDEELLPNAPPRRLLTRNAFEAGLRPIRSASEVMPSPLRMMTAMTAPF
jgi:integrase